jgi:hypothetical protein
MDEHVAGRTQTWRLAYNALTRQYRLSSGALHQNFATLEEALRVLGAAAQLEGGRQGARCASWANSYNAALRLKLDLTQLPKPFQVSAIGNKDWNITAEVKRWSFVAAGGGGAQMRLAPPRRRRAGGRPAVPAHLRQRQHGALRRPLPCCSASRGGRGWCCSAWCSWQLRRLWREYRGEVFGSRLKLRLMADACR